MNKKTVNAVQFVTYRGATYPWQCDHMGHMNIMWYVNKFDEANWNTFAKIGINPSYLRVGKFGMAGVQQNITYRRELIPGDIIEVRPISSQCVNESFSSFTKCATQNWTRLRQSAKLPPSISTEARENRVHSPVPYDWQLRNSSSARRSPSRATNQRLRVESCLLDNRLRCKQAEIRRKTPTPVEEAVIPDHHRSHEVIESAGAQS